MTGRLSPLAEPLRRLIAGQITDFFNDRAAGEKPVPRRTDGLFGPDSVAWRVHGDVGCMMVGGIASLLLQMLHPKVLAGVWDHSNFRADMHGRLRRTARFVALTTYGSRAQAEEAIAHVRGIHDRVHGTLPDGTPYSAHDPDLLAWVHLSGAIGFLDAWRRYAQPQMSLAEQDRYFAETAETATRLGADPVPRTRDEAERQIAAFRPALHSDARSREVARLVLSPDTPKRSAQPALSLTVRAAVDLLPDWARQMHGLPRPLVSRPLVHAGMAGLAGTLRWALRRPVPPPDARI